MTQSSQDRALQRLQPVIKVYISADLIELEVYEVGKGTCGAFLVDQEREGEILGVSDLGRKTIP